MIKPELGLYYSAVDYLTQEIVKTTTNMNSTTPIVIDCSNILQVDYTATQVNYFVYHVRNEHKLISILGFKWFNKSIQEEKSRNVAFQFE